MIGKIADLDLPHKVYDSEEDIEKGICRVWVKDDFGYLGCTELMTEEEADIFISKKKRI